MDGFLDSRISAIFGKPCAEHPSLSSSQWDVCSSVTISSKNHCPNCLEFRIWEQNLCFFMARQLLWDESSRSDFVG